MSFLSNMFSTTSNSFQNLSSAELEKQISELGYDQFNLIDVRTQAEHAGGHIPSSKNMDVMSPSFASQIDELDKDASYIIYCASGNRSKTACGIMASKGFKNLLNLSGGMMGWSGDIS